MSMIQKYVEWLNENIESDVDPRDRRPAAAGRRDDESDVDPRDRRGYVPPKLNIPKKKVHSTNKMDTNTSHTGELNAYKAHIERKHPGVNVKFHGKAPNGNPEMTFHSTDRRDLHGALRTYHDGDGKEAQAAHPHLYGRGDEDN